MWKDFFYFSKSERRSILVLMSIGILLLILGTWSHGNRRSSMCVADSIAIDSFCISQYHKQAARDSWRLKRTESKRPMPVLVNFDPNIADSANLCSLGLPPYMAKRIINYRDKGGVFLKPEDLSRMYGLSEEQFLALKPFIVIDQHRATLIQAERMKKKNCTDYDSLHSLVASARIQANSSEDSEDVSLMFPYRSQVKYPEGTVIDLNSADTTQLKQVPGIGRGLAKMIIAYRTRLGGYTTVNQLQEVAQIDTSVNRWFKIDSCIFRPIRVNHANLDQLRNHPYMDFYKAKVILEYRRKRGKIKGLSQLSMFQEFTEKDLQRLKPYLEFN